MLRLFFIAFLFFSVNIWPQQLVINELDANDDSTDDEEFIELKSLTPNFSTDGFILVFFNGNDTSVGNNLSYLVIDLNGYTTDSNGLLVLGNLNVAPFPQVVLSDGLFQNGADAVAIYQTSATNFPGETPATSAPEFNLIDALVYDTGSVSPVDTDLLAALGETTQYFEGSNTQNSLQLKADGTYEAKLPTARALNDGSGIVFNSVRIATSETQYNEGESFTISFTADQNVNTDLIFTISLDNETFTAADFSGSTTVTIPAGQNTASTTITVLDDTDDEGDEVIKIQFLDLVEPIVASNNLIEIRIVDNDFTIAPWGTPLTPTYGQVLSTQPSGYYSSLNGKSGEDLRLAIQNIIADEVLVRTHSYADAYNILELADQNPLNSNEVWMLYTEQSRSKLDRQTTGNSSGKWNREHTFPQSRGDFMEWEDFDEVATGINTFITTSADSLRHGFSDLHGLRVADGGENSRRRNRHYSNDFVGTATSPTGQYNGPANVNPANGVGISFRGDVARSTLYMELRYNGLEVVNGFPSSDEAANLGKLGDLATLLQWHESDPPDDFEMNRNNIIYNWQKNRNPLIDNPELVDFIWGSRQGEVWMGALSTAENELSNFAFYPNPTNDNIYFVGLNTEAKVEIYTIEGRKVSTLNIDVNNTANISLASGVYLLKVIQNDAIVTKRLIVE